MRGVLGEGGVPIVVVGSRLCSVELRYDGVCHSQGGEWLPTAVCLCFHLAGRRCLGMLAVLEAFPGHAISKQTNLSVVALARRSYANTPVCHDFADQLRSTNYTKVTASLNNLEVGFSCSETLVVENMFKSLRTAEVRAQDHKHMSLIRRWLTPIQRKMATAVFKYKTIAWRNQVISTRLKTSRAMPKRWFHPRRVQTSASFRSVSSSSSTAPFLFVQCAEPEAAIRGHGLASVCEAAEQVRRCASPLV